MSAPSIPSTMRAWQCAPGGGSLETTLKLNPAAPLPKRKPDMHLIQVMATALNPVDYKIVEIPAIPKLILPNPATPVIDFCGKVVQPAEGSSIKAGDLVFGHAGVHMLGGALAEYTLAKKDAVAIVPSGVSQKWAAATNVAGLTAYQSMVPYCKKGDSVFINGGSGGTGIFGIQIAKAKGYFVATTCSTTNVELCQSLGADIVIDYKNQDIVKALITSGKKYNHVVDNVGHDPDLFYKAHEYTTPEAIFVTVGGAVTVGHIMETIKMNLKPAFLGGGKRKTKGFTAVPSGENLTEIAQWMKDGQVKPIFDSEYKFEDVAKAFERLKTGRAKGKIIVQVSSEADMS